MPVFAQLARAVLAHRAATTLLLLGVLGVAVAGARQVQPDFSVEAFFGSEDEEVAVLAEHKSLWGSDDAVFLVILRAQEGSLLDSERLSVIERLTTALEADPHVAECHSLANAPALLGELPGLIELRTIVETRPQGPEGLEAWRKRVLSNSALVPFLLSEDERVTAVVVSLDTDADDVRNLAPVVEHVRGIAARFEGQAGLWIGTAGIPAVRADFFKLIFEDQMVTVPAVMVMIALLLFLLYRRPHGVLVPGLAAAIPTAIIFGAMGFGGEPLGILNQSYATLLPAIFIADAIHLVSRFHEEARRMAGPGELLSTEQRRLAIVRASRRIGLACLLTSATTSIGFFSLQLAGMPILRGFGLYAALGIVTAYGTVLLVIPLMLSVTRGSVPGQDGESLRRVDSALRACGTFSTSRPWVVLAVTAGVVVLSLHFSTRVVIDNELTAMLRSSHPTTIANTLVDDQLGGMLGIEIETIGPPGSHRDPAVLQALSGLEDWAAEQEGVRSTQGPANMLRLFTRATRGSSELPSRRAEVAEAFLVGEGAGLDSVLVLGGQGGTDGYARARTVIRVRDAGGRWIETFSQNLQAELDERFAGVAVTPHITGTPYVAYRGINRVTRDLRNSLILAFVVIAGLILLLFRSPRIALLCLIPNALPLLVGYALMGATGWILDPSPAVIFTVALGIAVDDTIHLVVRWREEREQVEDRLEAITRAVVHTGRAVTITTIVLAAGFGVNVLSSFPTMKVMALLGATVVTVALLCDLFVLPALLALWGEKRSKPEDTA